MAFWDYPTKRWILLSRPFGNMGVDISVAIAGNGWPPLWMRRMERPDGVMIKKFMVAGLECGTFATGAHQISVVLGPFALVIAWGKHDRNPH